MKEQDILKQLNKIKGNLDLVESLNLASGKSQGKHLYQAYETLIKLIKELRVKE